MTIFNYLHIKQHQNYVLVSLICYWYWYMIYERCDEKNIKHNMTWRNIYLERMTGKYIWSKFDIALYRTNRLVIGKYLDNKRVREIVYDDCLYVSIKHRHNKLAIKYIDERVKTQHYIDIHLIDAITYNNIEIVKYIFENYHNNIIPSSDEFFLLSAMDYQRTELISYFISKGAILSIESYNDFIAKFTGDSIYAKRLRMTLKQATELAKQVYSECRKTLLINQVKKFMPIAVMSIGIVGLVYYIVKKYM